MTLPYINFEAIRPIDGSRHSGFEEICAQLAALEPADPDALFVRKGRGGDGGVECYRRDPGGMETGWQAKYLFQWDASLAKQLDDSIETALAKHPRLFKYIVCVPFDLPDARTPRGKSARQKWDDWHMAWTKVAKDQGRTVSVELWGRSELVGRLTRDAGLSGGKVLYWFGTEAFTPAWFLQQFDNTKAAVGSRYVPESNVELPIRSDFLALARDASLQKQIDGWFIRASELGHSATQAVGRVSSPDASSHSEALKVAVEKLSEGFGRAPIRSDQSYPISTWVAAATECSGRSIAILQWLYSVAKPEAERSSDSDPVSTARHNLRRLLEELEDIRGDLSSRRWNLANQRAVLLTGDAGTGKSHLLADVVEHEVLLGRPAIMVLGSGFRDDEPWRQILTQLDRLGSEQVKQFLGALDAAAEAVDARALVCIDALNERNGINIWRDRLAAFLNTAAAFPRVAVVVSCRTTYLPYVIPSSLEPDKLFRVDHVGFAGDAEIAAATYLDMRGIVRPGAPILAPEFNNPLFLKTCCDFLEKDGLNELPRGLRGISSIFSFYNEAVTQAINRRMQLDPSYRIVPRAIDGFVKLIANSEYGYAEYADAIDFFESIHVSNGSFERSLLSQLVAEGLLSIEPIRQEEGSVSDFVRFTFERFSDHAIASQLLSTHLQTDDVLASFALGKHLYEFIYGKSSYEHAGVVEAISIQLPELTGVEISDVSTEDSWIVRDAFRHSLLWRNQSNFTDRTLEIARNLLGADEFIDLLIAVSTEPENKFNSRYLHSRLKTMTMPERDVYWSIHLVRNDFSGELETLVKWALGSGAANVEEERAYLACLILSWFLTTSHRTLRDRATKALASLLATRLALGARLLHDFDGVDDPYVVERLLAACYGAALQGNAAGLDQLSQAVYQVVFSNGLPLADALARDHANGIVEYAHWRGVLPATVDVQLCRPPYKSPWPIEYVSDELIARYVQPHEQGAFRDAIVGSAVNDGDFARYQMDYKITKWSPVPLGTQDLPNSQEVFGAWHAAFKAWSSKAQRGAFKKLRGAYDATQGKHDYEVTSEIASLKNARREFQLLLPSEKWEDFRVRAEKFLRFEQFQDFLRKRPAAFDVPWARRWVCKRAHDLGWTHERFGNFERENRSHDRMDHQVERIGKKYQWIALRELIARMADNLAYIGESWEVDEKLASAYPGAREIGLRDIDPSILIAKSYYDGWAEWPRTWWVPVQLKLRPMQPGERLTWLESNQDIVNDQSLIDVCDAKTGRRWLVLSTFAHWKCFGILNGQKEFQRDAWFRLRCIVIRKADLKACVRALSGKTLTYPHSLESIELGHEFHLGEYPWHPGLKNVDEWTKTEDKRAPVVPVRPTTAQYSCETGGYDYSLDSSVRVEVPAPWLATAMGLHLANGRHPVYEDSAGNIRFFDPSLIEPGPAAALVDRDAFLQMLEHDGLAAVWVITGEKNVYGGPDSGRGFGGRFAHTAVYWFDENLQHTPMHGEWTRPTSEQLAEFMGDTASNANRALATAQSKARTESKSMRGATAARKKE